jgi:hypothetical protein
MNWLSPIVILGAFMLFFFDHISRDNNFLSKIDALSNKSFLAPYEWLGKTFLQIGSYIAFSGFCAFTFVAPAISVLLLRLILMNCCYL